MSDFVQDAADLLEFFARKSPGRREQVTLLSEALRTAYDRGMAAGDRPAGPTKAVLTLDRSLEEK